MFKRIIVLALMLLMASPSFSQKKNSGTTASKDTVFNSGVLSGFTFRSIGPAVTSGRVSDVEVNPNNINEYFVAAASGGVWKTTNAGITYTPVLDKEGSYSIGCVTIDPNNSNVVWVGTGENNNQRSVAYGDGVYKSEDGGKSWKNMGLKNSEHTGMIVVDPSNSDVVYVAAYGPLWSAGGDRGIYKTTDGGKTWKNILSVSEHTGCNEIHMDPRNNNVLYATAHQRRRQGFTYISGGPESGIYKSTDAGATWNKINKGLPDTDLGRIGMGVSPVNPDVLYCMVEASDKKGGMYRSTDRGASWERRGDLSTSGNYYVEIFCDPQNVDKIFSMDFFITVSTDGGKTFKTLGEKYKHVDNHALWINPKNTNHLLAGCDGGLYETFDYAANWEFKSNLPITQFYKVAVDNATPFYNVYGGTQDNNTLGGPSRTKSANGIHNMDWVITTGGDGFETVVDPKDPNIVYSESQYGGLVRYDKKSGEALDIKPVEGENEPGLRWNWDAPIIISKHTNTRLYFGANKLFRSDDRGENWIAISGDLSRQIDRNKLPVMGKVWSMDAVAKNQSTDIYGQLVSIAESPFDENHLVVGTDDGLIQVTTDGGKNWTKIESFPGVPDRTYVNQIVASRHDKYVFYAMFNHHRYGDFKPYIYKSVDGGRTWSSISNNLPERGSTYCMVEDPINKNLLFVGTEFGVYCSINGGNRWVQMKGGLPTVAVRDMEIQERESDLVLATFGRGFYILDDYSPLRKIKVEDLEQPAIIYPIKESVQFIEYQEHGFPLKGFLGEGFYACENPKQGTVFTYYLKEDIKTIKERRQEREKEKVKKGEPVYYPSADSIRLEDNQAEPYLLFTIKDANGTPIRNLKTAPKKGLKRLNWDLRYAASNPVNFYKPDPNNPWDQNPVGPLALPGNYTVTLSKVEDGITTELVLSQPFSLRSLNLNTFTATDKKAYDEFCKEVSELRRVLGGTNEYRNEIGNKLKFIKQALIETPSTTPALVKSLNDIQVRLNAINLKLFGDGSLAKREFETAPSINDRIGTIEYGMWNTTTAPTGTFRKSFAIADKELKQVISDLKSIGADMQGIENTLDQLKAPYTPGRTPFAK
ncbi:MAG: glycosyl hydrolase [Bacteroidetes bacterium]|nr:glycosyl hydrolase [Bacteroidota bacterium]